jgi:tripartite-type tricarboxylate transporter receptor subunit TctC
VQGGRIRPLAVAGDARIPTWPDVPTAAEAGLPGFSAPGWFGLVAPAAVPDAIVERLNAEVQAVLRLPEVEVRLAELGAAPAPGTAEDFGRLLAVQRTQWAEAVAAAKVSVQ